MHFRFVDYALWFLTPVILCGVLGVMMRRRLTRQYPFFCAYVILQILSDPILAVISSRLSYTTYYQAYYVQLILSFAISAAVVWEIFRKSLGIRFHFQGPIPVLLLWLGAVLLAGISALIASGRPDANAMAWIVVADRTLRSLQIITAIAFSMFAAQLGISKRSTLYGIVLGFGFFAAINMAVSKLATPQGISTAALSRMNSIGYLISCFIWLFYMALGTQDSAGYDLPRYSRQVDCWELEGKDWKNWLFRRALGASGWA